MYWVFLFFFFSVNSSCYYHRCTLSWSWNQLVRSVFFFSVMDSFEVKSEGQARLSACSSSFYSLLAALRSLCFLSVFPLWGKKNVIQFKCVFKTFWLLLLCIFLNTLDIDSLFLGLETRYFELYYSLVPWIVLRSEVTYFLLCLVACVYNCVAMTSGMQVQIRQALWENWWHCQTKWGLTILRSQWPVL